MDFLWPLVPTSAPSAPQNWEETGCQQHPAPAGSREPISAVSGRKMSAGMRSLKAASRAASCPNSRQLCCNFFPKLSQQPFYNVDRKDYKQLLPPKQLIFTGKIEEQGKGQFCLVS